MTATIQLKYATFEILSEPCENGHCGVVRTLFPDGLSSDGFREVNPQNITEAKSQGYSGPFAIWHSLVDHELLHSIVAEVLFDRPSVVLRTESGEEFNLSWERYEEEMYAIAFQVYCHAQSVPRPIENLSVSQRVEITRRFFSSRVSLDTGK